MSVLITYLDAWLVHLISFWPRVCCCTVVIRVYFEFAHVVLTHFCMQSLMTVQLIVQGSVESGNMPMALTPRMPHAGSALSEPQASTELLFRMNHARQTVEFVHRQVSSLPCILYCRARFLAHAA